MIHRGTWYVHTPENGNSRIVYWTDGLVDWYSWSRMFFNVTNGEDATRGFKLMVVDDIIISCVADVTTLPYADTFDLYVSDVAYPVGTHIGDLT